MDQPARTLSGSLMPRVLSHAYVWVPIMAPDAFFCPRTFLLWLDTSFIRFLTSTHGRPSLSRSTTLRSAFGQIDGPTAQTNT